MLLILRVMVMLGLLVIFIQDIKYKAVSWVLFPALALIFLYLNYVTNGSSGIYWQSLLANSCFLAVVLLVLTLYFFIKSKKLVTVTAGLFSWGDILFLLAIAFYLSFLNYIFFYLLSLPAVLLIWLLWQGITKHKSPHIPLAGLQAVLFLVFLIGDWYFFHFDAMDDTWLLAYLTP